jgi:hypothetical protein
VRRRRIVAVAAVLGGVVAAAAAVWVWKGDSAWSAGDAVQCPWEACDGDRLGHERLLDAAKAASEHGRMWMAELAGWQQDEVWVFSHLLCRRPDAWFRARALVEREKLRHLAPSGRLMDPTQPGPGIAWAAAEERASLLTYVAASTADPENVALELLRQFLGRGEEARMLTHQLLVLVWWEDVGRSLPQDLADKRPTLLAQIPDEHEFDRRFTDLYAERAMILALFGDAPCPAGLPEWTRSVLEAQDETGGWPDAVMPHGHGEARPQHDAAAHEHGEDHAEHGPTAKETGTGELSSHTTALSLAVVEAYIDCMEPHPQARGTFVPWRGVCGQQGAALAR